MFQPPRCPYRACSEHAAPSQSFWIRHGSYAAKCRSRPVPRFRCKACLRTFSRQTFRMDYRDHRPDINARLFRYLSSGVGLRQSSRLLGLTLRCTELKFRKLARHLRRLNLNLQIPLPEGSKLQFDEFETYEGRRNTRPLSVPVLIETSSRFIIWAESATIRPHGRMSPGRTRAVADDERRFGRRRDNSRRSIRRTLARGEALTSHLDRVTLQTDEKSVYPRLAKEIFGAGRLDHGRTNSRLARGTWNPLFPINHTEAMARDLSGRLRRDSWLVSKKRRYLDLGLQLLAAYLNHVRPRFNGETHSRAQMLGVTSRPLRPGELLGWRQDWGSRSISPEPCRRVG